MSEKVILESAYVYPSYKDVDFWQSGKYLGCKLKDIPRYYLEWYVGNGYDEFLVALCDAWLSSIESSLVYGFYETQQGWEEISNNMEH